MSLPESVSLATPMDRMEIPSFLEHQAAMDFPRLVSSLNARYPDTNAAKLDIGSVSELVGLGLDPAVADSLSRLIGTGISEWDIVVVFLAILSGGNYGKGFSRYVKRLIRSADKQTVLAVSVRDAVGDIIDSV